MRRRKYLSAPALGAVAVLAATSVAWAAGGGSDKPLDNNLVGRQADGSVLTAENKYVTPAGDNIEQTGRPMDLAIAPDGKTAVDLTKSGDGLFTVIDLANKKVLQQYTPPKGTGSGNVGVGGVLYSPDGKTVWVTQTTDILKFAVAADGTLAPAPQVIALPTTAAGGATPPASKTGSPATQLPTDLAYTPDGKNILVVLDGYNTLGVMDAATGAFSTQTQVGVAPRDVAVIGNHAFVSNEGGRQPTSEDFANYSYDSPVVAEQVDGRANNGTVSEIDLATGTVVQTYQVGLDPSSMLVNGTELMVTNSSDDTVSVIDTAAGQVGQTFNVNPLPGKTIGSSPNALAFIDATHLAVSLGRDNAVAVYTYTGAKATPVFSGLIPTAWYPGGLHWDAALGKLVVANLKGVGALGADRTVTEGPDVPAATGRQVYADKGSVQLVSPPTPAEISTYTATVFANNRWNGLAERNQKGSKRAAPVAVPVKVGDPSTIKHVFVIVKENRTYDQVLGDDPRGNGNPAYAQFGKKVTPNAHALSQEYPLIDNLYSNGTNSAVGHTWMDAAFVNDYLERSYANYTRNYGQPDAMVYPRSGFLWDNAQAHGLSTRMYGEYATYFTAPNGTGARGTWQQWYNDSKILEGKATGQLHAPLGYYQTKSDMPSLDGMLNRTYPNFTTSVPDQFRVDVWQKEFAQYEKDKNLPSLNMMWVMANHTNGVKPGFPTPDAMVADNDLALGRIVQTISHSRDWRNTAIFVVEDDSQNGVDHVDGHRAPVEVISPYAKRHAVVHSYYTQVNVTRTVEQILGLPPMNQVDLAAEPMYGVFGNRANNKPYTALPNNIPLDKMNVSAAQATSPIQKQWIAWSGKQDYNRQDMLAFAPFNRMTWYASNNFTKPYPGDSKVMTPAEVLKKFPQSTVQADPDEATPQTRSLQSRAMEPHTAGR